MKDARPFEGIVSEKSSGELSEQERLLNLKLECGTKKRGQVTSSMVGSFHLITVKEAGTHCHDIISNAEQQFYIFQGASLSCAIKAHLNQRV